ncbi:MAG: NAD-dependent epimerase/dehydratase family protein [Thermoprotei archaeon]
MKFLVFGCTGFIGSQVVAQLLAKGEEVWGFSRNKGKDAAIGDDEYHHIYGDLLNSSDVGKAVNSVSPDRVIFCAGESYMHRKYSKEDLEAIYGSRVNGLGNVIDSMSPSSGVRLVTVSDALAYTVRPRYKDEGDLPSYTEEDPIDESLWTGRIAVDLEKQIRRAVSKDITASSARLGAVYGLGGLWGEMFLRSMFDKRRIRVPGNGSSILSFVHVKDAASALVYLVDKASAGETYNVVDDEPVSIHSFLSTASQVFGSPKPQFVPMSLGRVTFGALVPQLILPAFKTSRPVSNSKLKKYDFVLAYPRFADGLKELAKTAQSSS